jgi:hypothetical protein
MANLRITIISYSFLLFPQLLPGAVTGISQLDKKLK